MRSIFGGQKHCENSSQKCHCHADDVERLFSNRNSLSTTSRRTCGSSHPTFEICWVGDGCELYCFRQTELPTVAFKKGDKRHCAHCAHCAHCIVLIVIVVVFCLSDKFFECQGFLAFPYLYGRSMHTSWPLQILSGSVCGSLVLPNHNVRTIHRDSNA